MKALAAVLILLGIGSACSPPPGGGKATARNERAAARERVESTARETQPFDYYVLSLSWSPEHCAETRDNSEQCAGNRAFGFVVHGLWPQNEQGYPDNCAGADFDPEQVPQGLTELMPSMQLIRHEWTAHGRCTGLDERSYFEKVRRARQRVTIPARFGQPLESVETTPGEARAAFAEANAWSAPEDFAIADNGRFLREVRVCLTKELQFRRCSEPGDRKERTLILRPVR